MVATPLRVLFPLFAALAVALPAQGDKPKPDGKADKAAKAAPKDDAVTQKDAAIVAIDKFIDDKVSKKRADWKTSLTAPPALPFDATHDYFWHVETSKGTLQLELFADTAPQHVGNIVYLARLGFYDGLVFHRVLKNFMAQGGCPLGNGTGGPGYYLDGEYAGGRKHDRPGILSTANRSKPMTDGSQFFITFVPTPGLNGKHTIAGAVVAGLDVLKELEAAGVERDGMKMAEPPAIVKTWITVAKKPAKPAEPAKGDGGK